VSLGLPEFGSRGPEDEARGIWRVVQIAGFAALAYALAMAATEGMAASSAERSMEKARAEVATLAQSAEAAKRTLLKSADLLVAASSVESSPARVVAELKDDKMLQDPAPLPWREAELEYLKNALGIKGHGLI